MIEVGRALKEQDGANAIVMGCAGMARHRKPLEDALGIPVIDPTQAAVTMALISGRLNGATYAGTWSGATLEGTGALEAYLFNRANGTAVASSGPSSTSGAQAAAAHRRRAKSACSITAPPPLANAPRLPVSR